MKALGLDLGTTSLSAVVLETDSGVLAAKTVQNAAFLPGERWERTQNAEEIYAAALPLVQELVCEHPEICAIGVTGQMHGIVYLDTDGRVSEPALHVAGRTAALPFNETESWAAHLSAVTGYPAAPGYGLATHYYNVHHGLVPETAACFCTIADFVAMRLAGRTSPLLDGSNAASLGLFDLQNGCFDKDAAEKAGLSPHLLPQVSKNAYLGTGTFKIPVYAAIGDNQAAFLGAVDDRKHTLLVNVGTGSQVAVFTPGYLSVPGLETRPTPAAGIFLWVRRFAAAEATHCWRISSARRSGSQADRISAFTARWNARWMKPAKSPTHRKPLRSFRARGKIRRFAEASEKSPAKTSRLCTSCTAS